MTRIAVLTRTVTSGDAVGNDALGMHEALKREGLDARIYAESWTLTEPLIESAATVGDFLKSASDLVIYHHSIGWESGLEILSSLPCKVVIKYHNITPPSFFAGISEEFVNKCRAGREQIAALIEQGHELYLSDSEYNMRELLEAGAPPERNFVLPPFHHIDLLESINPDLSVVDNYRTGVVNLLTVGRVSPNKGHVALIEAFANYYFNYNSNSRLIVIGKRDNSFKPYYRTLRRLISRLCLEQAIIFAGGVSDQALKAYYQSAHLFVTASEHEGFCVPLVEAMAMKLPILAYSSSAIPGTVGDAGIIWQERNPLLMAETIDTLIKDESLRASMAQRGWRRYQELYTNSRIEGEFLKVIGKLI